MGVRPLTYSSVIRYYTNWPSPSIERSAALIQQAIPGCESISADDVENWPAGRTDLLEYAIQAASEILSDVEDDERGPPAEESGGMMAPPEDPIETTEFVEADMIHSLIEKNHSMQDIYGLLIPEIELIGEGAERAADRRDNGDSETPDAPAVGNRGGSHTAMFH